MGRFISTGTTQVGTNCCQAVINSTCYQVNTHRYNYDNNACWQNRVIVDTPGSYSFTVPAGVTCLRTIAVGGGGKSYINCSACCGTAGGGGGYAERQDTVASGCVVTVVVGRQQQDTTISYTNSAGTARVLTGGGAVGPAGGVASGGDWNSNGGNGGINCNYCGGLSHYCGSCIYQYATTCCGYCVVWSGVSARQLDPPHGSNDCCVARYSGGGSAGSWIWSTGGMGQCAGNAVPVFSLGYGASAGGGGGIGVIGRSVIRSPWCTCTCHKNGYNGTAGGNQWRNVDCPNAAGGGGGTKWMCCFRCDCQTWEGTCQQGRYRNGPGGWGGRCNNEGRGAYQYWGYRTAPNGHGLPYHIDVPQGPSPCKYEWHDIHEMQGSGTSGRSMMGVCWPNQDFMNSTFDCMPDPIAGEGAGTGGMSYHCCALTFHYPNCCTGGVDACGSIHWPLICCLGTTNRMCCADKMSQALFPYIVSCAGTLGGSGGTGVCHLASKAGKGGGAGVNRSYILCICWGGSFNLCNGSGAALAFPPCDLDWRASTAGTGMAIIYWKDA